MTVIQPNSISGITSITAQGDTLTLYKSDGTNIGQLDVNVYASSGVSTVANLNVIGGNVGIGTDNPNHLLTLEQEGTGNFDALNFRNGSTNANGYQMGINPTGDIVHWNTSNSDIIVASNNTERLRINSSGSVGIGTTNPTSTLTVNGGIGATTLSVTGFSTFNYAVRFNTNTDYIQIDSPNNRMLFRDSHSLFFGNGNDLELVHDGSTTRITNGGPLIIRNNSVSGVTSISGNTVGTIADFTQDGEVRIPGQLLVGTGGTVVTTTSSGLVGIGTTNPTSKLHVYGNAVGFVTTLTDGATITPDFGSANNFTVTLGGNRTIANPTNMVVGQSGFISIVQDGTGSRTVSWGSYWDFPASTAPTLTTTANGVDVVAYYVRTTTSIAADAIIGIGTL